MVKHGLLSSGTARGLLAAGVGMGMGIAATQLWHKMRKPKDLMEDTLKSINRTRDLFLEGKLRPRSGALIKIVQPFVEDVLPGKQASLEKQALLARIYAAGRAAGKGLLGLPRVNIGGSKLLVSPLSVGQLRQNVVGEFTHHDVLARKLLKRTLGQGIARGSNVAMRGMGFPGDVRRDWIFTVANHPLAGLAGVSLPFLPGSAALGAVASRYLKKGLKIPTGLRDMSEGLVNEARSKGYKNLKDYLAAQENPRHPVTRLYKYWRSRKK